MCRCERRCNGTAHAKVFPGQLIERGRHRALQVLRNIDLQPRVAAVRCVFAQLERQKTWFRACPAAVRRVCRCRDYSPPRKPNQGRNSKGDVLTPRHALVLYLAAACHDWSQTPCGFRTEVRCGKIDSSSCPHPYYIALGFVYLFPCKDDWRSFVETYILASCLSIHIRHRSRRGPKSQLRSHMAMFGALEVSFLELRRPRSLCHRFPRKTFAGYTRCL